VYLTAATLCAAYSATLVSCLAARKNPLPFKTFEDLLKTNDYQMSLVNHSAVLSEFEVSCHVSGGSKKLGDWYQKTNKTEDTNKLTLLAYKTIAILHNTLLATFIKLLETVGKGLVKNRSQNRCHTFLDCRHVCKTRAFYDAL
jgi:hypothetical protein